MESRLGRVRGGISPGDSEGWGGLGLQKTFGFRVGTKFKGKGDYFRITHF